MYNLLLTENKITDTILLVRDKYIKNGIAKSFYDINNGLCTEFAEEVIKLLGGETDNLYGVTNCNFTDSNETHFYHWDSELLEKACNILPPYNLTWNNLQNVCFGDHYWIFFNKKFYDCECPNGVSNFFNLPIFNRVLKKILIE